MARNINRAKGARGRCVVRRFKVDSELTREDRERLAVPNGPDRIEREEYARARRDALRVGEGDDPVEHARALREEAEAIRYKAAIRGDKAPKPSVQDYLDQLRSRNPKPFTEPASVIELRELADEYEAQANEIAPVGGSLADGPSVEDELDRIQSNRVARRAA